VTTNQRWYPREHTKHGGVLPPRTNLNRYGSSSSAIRRHEARIDEKRILANYVQLAPGVLVIWDRKPWRVVEVTERPLDLWGAKYDEAFADDLARWEEWPGKRERPEKATWDGRPVTVAIVPDGKPAEKPLHLIGPAHHRWDVLPEHYAICSQCGELPPCRHEEAEREADVAIAHAEALMEIPAGHCLGCGEQITSRQKAVRFPGPNLWRPDLGEGSAVFHARRECSDPVYRYRTQFEATGGQDQQMTLNIDDPTT
jgi:hypothetical protein